MPQGGTHRRHEFCSRWRTFSETVNMTIAESSFRSTINFDDTVAREWQTNDVVMLNHRTSYTCMTTFVTCAAVSLKLSFQIIDWRINQNVKVKIVFTQLLICKKINAYCLTGCWHVFFSPSSSAYYLIELECWKRKRNLSEYIETLKRVATFIEPHAEYLCADSVDWQENHVWRFLLFYLVFSMCADILGPHRDTALRKRGDIRTS